MATVTIGGVTLPIPSVGDQNWSAVLNAVLSAQASSSFYRSGGSQPLTVELDLGANFGLRLLSIRSKATVPATSGFIRMGNTEQIKWRNGGNTADLALGMSVDEETLHFNGSDIVNLVKAQTLTNKTLTSPIINSPTITDAMIWTGVTYQNSWVSSTAASNQTSAQYYKDSSGIVHIRGAIAAGANNTIAFTLPSGYRPQSVYQFVINARNAFPAMAEVSTSGAVTIFIFTGVGSYTPGGAGGEWFSFGHISFKAA